MSMLNHVWGQSPAADRVWAQVVGMASPVIANEYLMLFQVFIDDSSRHDEAFVLGGHVASVETWAEFSKEWEELLPLCYANKEGVRRFKMGETPLTEDGLWKAAAFYKIIEKYPIVSISSAAIKSHVRDAQNNIFLPDISFNMLRQSNWGYFDNMFILLFRMIMDGFHQNRDRISSIVPVDAEVQFIFDESAEKKIIRDGWDRYVANRPDNLRHLYQSEPRFEKDERFMPLQAADLWAWWIREKIYSNGRNEEETRLSKKFLAEVEKSPRKILHFHLDRSNTMRTMMEISRSAFVRSRGYNIKYFF